MSDFEEYAGNTIRASFREHAELLARCGSELQPGIARAARLLRDVVLTKRKIMLCGNGGSAADSQHLAAEFMGWYKKVRMPIHAIALTTDSSILTAIGNDYNFEHVFARQVYGMAREGDVLIAISTSGNSANVLEAVSAAKSLGCITMALVGRDGGELARQCDHAIVVPSNDTARIQEMHILVGHILCDLVESSWHEATLAYAEAAAG